MLTMRCRMVSFRMLWEGAQDGIPRQLTLVGQKPREAMERLSLMQFARVRLRETTVQSAEEALGRLPLAKTRVWKPDHDRALLTVCLLPSSDMDMLARVFGGRILAFISTTAALRQLSAIMPRVLTAMLQSALQLAHAVCLRLCRCNRAQPADRLT